MWILLGGPSGIWWCVLIVGSSRVLPKDAVLWTKGADFINSLLSEVVERKWNILLFKLVSNAVSQDSRENGKSEVGSGDPCLWPCNALESGQNKTNCDGLQK